MELSLKKKKKSDLKIDLWISISKRKTKQSVCDSYPQECLQYCLLQQFFKNPRFKILWYHSAIHYSFRNLIKDLFLSLTSTNLLGIIYLFIFLFPTEMHKNQNFPFNPKIMSATSQYNNWKKTLCIFPISSIFLQFLLIISGESLLLHLE